jgi:hypothetical protein
MISCASGPPGLSAKAQSEIVSIAVGAVARNITLWWLNHGLR